MHPPVSATAASTDASTQRRLVSRPTQHRTPARLLLKIVRLAYVSLSMPVETVGAWCLQCRSYRGAEPPCVFVQTACGSTPTASQRWNFLQLSDSGNVDDGSVHIVHSSAGLCLASRCSATRNCSASHPTVFQHNQLEVTKCDATSLLQVCPSAAFAVVWITIFCLQCTGCIHMVFHTHFNFQLKDRCGRLMAALGGDTIFARRPSWAVVHSQDKIGSGW